MAQVVSSRGNTFNGIEFSGEELPGASAFYKDTDGQVFHTYSRYARGLDLMIGAYNWLDIAPRGHVTRTDYPHRGLGAASRQVPLTIERIAMGRPVVHFELMSKDPGKLSDFYAQVFDWKIQHVPEMNYRIVETGGEGGINGGIMKPEREGPWPGNMLFYIAVDDLAAYRKKVIGAGGKIHVEEQEVPGMGAFSLFTDPEGRMVGLWKPAKK